MRAEEKRREAEKRADEKRKEAEKRRLEKEADRARRAEEKRREREMQKALAAQAAALKAKLPGTGVEDEELEWEEMVKVRRSSLLATFS